MIVSLRSVIGQAIAMSCLSLAPAAGVTVAQLEGEEELVVRYAQALEDLWAGNIEDAIGGFEAVALSPNQVSDEKRRIAAGYHLALAYELAGQREDALGQLERTMQFTARVPRGARLDEPEDFLGVHWVRRQPAFDALRADPRFPRIEALLVDSGETRRRRFAEKALARRGVIESGRELVDESRVLWFDGHVGLVRDVEFSPDGERLASHGWDRTVRLWSTRHDDVRRLVGIHDSVQVELSFGSGSDLLLVRDGRAATATVYDGKGGEHWLDLYDGDELVLDAALARGARAWSVTGDGALRLWDVWSGQLVDEIPQDPPVSTVEVSPDGSRIVVLDEGGGATLLDAYSGAALRRVGVRGMPLRVARFNPDGRLRLEQDDGAIVLSSLDGSSRPVVLDVWPASKTKLATGDGSRMLLENSEGQGMFFDTISGRPIVRLLGALPRGDNATAVGASIFVAAHGVIATGGGIWDSRTGGALPDFDTHTSIHSLACDIDDRIAVGTFDGVFLLDRDGSGRSLVNHAALVRGLSISPSGRIATGLQGNRPLSSEPGPWSPELPAVFPRSGRVWSSVDGRQVASYESLHCEPGFSPLSEKLVLASPSGGFMIENDGRRVDLPWGRPKKVRFSRDGSRIALTDSFGTQGSRARLVTSHGELIAQIEGLGHNGNQDQVCPARLTPDGRYFLCAVEGGPLGVYDGTNGDEVAILDGHRVVIQSMAFAPDRPWVATTASDFSVRVWDLDALEPVVQIDLETRNIFCSAFSPDGLYLAVGSDGGLPARIYDTRDWSLVHELSGHAGTIWRMAFHPVSGHLVTAGGGGQARIWNAETGEELALLLGHLGGIRKLAFLPNGSIVTSGDDATVRIWSAEGELLVTHVDYDEDGWLTFEPGGRYVAGGKAETWAKVRAARGGELYPLSSYATMLRDPEAIRQALAGNVPRRVGSLPRAPEITVLVDPDSDVAERVVEVKAHIDDDYGISEIVVERDGTPWARAMVDGAGEDGVPALEGVTYARGNRRADIAITVPFAPGSDSADITVRVTNRRGVKSLPAQIFRTYVPPIGDLYLLAIAVADYDDDRLDLMSPLKDARGVLDRFQAEEGHTYGTVHSRSIGLPGDVDVSIGALEEARATFLSLAGPDDTIVVFVAGHGVKHETGGWYFLTKDATPIRPFTGVPRPTLKRLVLGEGLQSKRRVLFIDACHAGEEFRPSGTRGVGVDDAFEQKDVDDALSGGSGVYIVSASSAAGIARETAENGVFTRALLDGLDGAADTRVPRRKIDIDELIDFIEDEVRRNGSGQKVTTPDVEGGDSFWIATPR